MPVLLDAVAASGFTPDIAVLDRGYDSEGVYETVAGPGRGIRPVIPLRETPAVKAGRHKPRRAGTACGRSPG